MHHNGKRADGGTLFLDEVGEMPLSVQKSFLRMPQERRFRQQGGGSEKRSEFRLVAATNRNLDRMVQRRHFRKDGPGCMHSSNNTSCLPVSGGLDPLPCQPGILLSKTLSNETGFSPVKRH
ncbi:MAG: sigma-54 factor interaction domain-containing protein [Syntrophobacteraceae bacterium]|nr:sigma-54 factor interaction domain-containing protein [Syntrophobacteraceae bacterium]